MIPGPVGSRPPQLGDPYSYASPEQAEQARFIQAVLGNFGLSLLLAAAGVYLAWSLPPVAFLPLVLVEFGLLLAVIFARRATRVAPFLLYAFAAISGATTVPLLQWAIQMGGSAVVFNALAVSGGLFSVMAWYGYSTRRDLAGWSTFLGIGLIGVVLASLVGLFITHTPMTQLMISSAVVVLFTAFVAYDLNQIREHWREMDVTTATLNLYLDFLNLFVSLLRILAILSGGGSSRD